MGKKKFIDKKQSATYRLVFKESSSGVGGGTDRIFVRLDGGDSHVLGFDPEPEEEHEREQLEESRSRDLTSEDVRREMLELGFPDDGYNYLQHLREIGPSGRIGDFVPSTRVRLDRLHPDVKAIDASNVRVHNLIGNEDMSDPSALGVNGFGRTIRGPVSKVIDPDVAALLEVDDDGSIVSDDELEDDFVIVANENAEGSLAEKNGSEDEFKTMKMISDHVDAYEKFEEDTDDDNDGNEEHERPARLLDEQFELLALREYDDDEIGEVDDDDISAHGPAHISKFNHIMSDFLINNAYIPDKYQTPAEIKSSNEDAIDQLDSALNKSESCPLSIPELDKRNILVSAISYESSTSEKDLVVEEDSDSEGSMWDCESIVTKYSNLDNHPGKICAIPKVPRKNSKQNEDGQSVIRLGGKQQLPVDYLPKKVQSQGGHKNKGSCESKTVNVVQRRADETKEEKKARKAAIKEERRNARASKKDLKLIYKDEAHRAQKTAASTGPATLRL